MVNINDIEGFFPENIRIARFSEYMLKEYIHYKMLDILSKSQFSEKLSFIGGSCLRIIHGIKRFSEDLDFDNFGMNEQEFIEMTDFITSKLKANAYPAVIIDKEKDKKLNAFRRNIHFPELLYKQGISGHKKKKFLNFQHLVFSDIDRQKLNDFKFVVRSLEFSRSQQPK